MEVPGGVVYLTRTIHIMGWGGGLQKAHKWADRSCQWHLLHTDHFVLSCETKGDSFKIKQSLQRFYDAELKIFRAMFQKSYFFRLPHCNEVMHLYEGSEIPHFEIKVMFWVQV